jgi:site-specific recombinase XerD
MESRLITDIEQEMLKHLDNHQMEQLHEVLTYYLRGMTFTPVNDSIENSNENLHASFLAAKRVEGCSSKSLRYYESTINNMLFALNKPVKHITTDDLRQYLDKYQQKNGASKATIDNIRRILSSFFTWLEEENIILKSPVRRIHKVKTKTTVKETYSDEALEMMRDHCGSIRDLAIIDLLASTGMRVGELVGLNRADIDFINRECIVFGKGDKERKVYFDARTKIHLNNYLDTRTDENPALFVSLQKPNDRLQISGVEIRLRVLGHKLKIPRVHPHKFRRTLATMAIDKGMPIEQVQHLLGHQNVDTTLQYAMVNQNNVKNSHRKYIA